MTDWASISALATAGGTLALAGVTFASVSDPTSPEFAEARDAIENRRPMTIEVLYGDHEGGQRVISRFALWPRSDGQWIAAIGRHWNVDRPDPR